MPRKAAVAAGITSLLLLCLLMATDTEFEVGGPALPRPLRILLILSVCVLANGYWTYKIGDAIARNHIRTDQAETRLLIKETEERFHAALEATMAEVYRMGMVSGAHSTARPARLVQIQRGGD